MKLILSICVIATFLLDNSNQYLSNSNKENEKTILTPNCQEAADATLAAYQAAMLKRGAISTHEQEYDVWISPYDNCGGGYDQAPVYI